MRGLVAIFAAGLAVVAGSCSLLNEDSSLSFECGSGPPPRCEGDLLLFCDMDGDARWQDCRADGMDCLDSNVTGEARCCRSPSDCAPPMPED